ncbi:VOC family protein [Chondromyces apiculatus]|uniref:Lactoylglutathione lyase n=1 Tax=Chondromyces apiculatus DSM 436 TaxID=1192034 RepID=A0A017TC19_9BACT|nr:VOC family protein [Chondromyces apiculatus]EYF06794.1 Lactoylglutathione lyase [Chondromyces apiculatus DSM 436]
MEFQRGRLIDHVHLVVRDVEASKRFYSNALKEIGIVVGGEGAGYFFVDELYVSEVREGESLTGRVHLAFQAPDQEAVRNFYEAALASGGKDNGAPGERKYHPGYYAAFILDPDGNNIEIVHHGPSHRSAAAVTITPAH